MRIAILGGGFAGLSVAWHLLDYSRGGVSIDLFDPLPIGEGVSGLSSGLLHAFAGKHAKKVWQADAGMVATHRLITESSKALGQSVVLSNGILRPAVTEEQKNDFKIAAKEHLETQWWDEQTCHQKVQGLQVNGGALYIKDGLTLDVPLYLKGLKQACAIFGTQFFQKAITSQEQLAKYEKVVITMGIGALSITPLNKLPLTPIKGQIIEIAWPHTIPPLPMSLVSHGYLVMEKGRRSCIAGSTFERVFTSNAPEPEVAKKIILEKILPFFPSLTNSEILDCRAGIRASSPLNYHRPYAGMLNKDIWFLTGLGSKGLLYHGWLGDLLARALLENAPSLLPKEVMYNFNQ